VAQVKVVPETGSVTVAVSVSRFRFPEIDVSACATVRVTPLIVAPVSALGRVKLLRTIVFVGPAPDVVEETVVVAGVPSMARPLSGDEKSVPEVVPGVSVAGDTGAEG
jgi:hypothetical protein